MTLSLIPEELDHTSAGEFFTVGKWGLHSFETGMNYWNIHQKGKLKLRAFCKMLPSKSHKFVPRSVWISQVCMVKNLTSYTPAGFFRYCSTGHLILMFQLNEMKISCLKIPCFLALFVKAEGELQGIRGSWNRHPGEASAELLDLAHLCSTCSAQITSLAQTSGKAFQNAFIISAL